MKLASAGFIRENGILPNRLSAANEIMENYKGKGAKCQEYFFGAGAAICWVICWAICCTERIDRRFERPPCSGAY